jgi:hypothetical protein
VLHGRVEFNKGGSARRVHNCLCNVRSREAADRIHCLPAGKRDELDPVANAASGELHPDKAIQAAKLGDHPIAKMLGIVVGFG